MKSMTLLVAFGLIASSFAINLEDVKIYRNPGAPTMVHEINFLDFTDFHPGVASAENEHRIFTRYAKSSRAEGIQQVNLIFTEEGSATSITIAFPVQDDLNAAAPQQHPLTGISQLSIPATFSGSVLNFHPDQDGLEGSVYLDIPGASPHMSGSYSFQILYSAASVGMGSDLLDVTTNERSITAVKRCTDIIFDTQVRGDNQCAFDITARCIREVSPAPVSSSFQRLVNGVSQSTSNDALDVTPVNDVGLFQFEAVFGVDNLAEVSPISDFQFEVDLLEGEEDTVARKSIPSGDIAAIVPSFAQVGCINWEATCNNGDSKPASPAVDRLTGILAEDISDDVRCTVSNIATKHQNDCRGETVAVDNAEEPPMVEFSCDNSCVVSYTDNANNRQGNDIKSRMFQCNADTNLWEAVDEPVADDIAPNRIPICDCSGASAITAFGFFFYALFAILKNQLL